MSIELSYTSSKRITSTIWRFRDLQVINGTDRMTIFWDGWATEQDRVDGFPPQQTIHEDIVLTKENIGQIYAMITPMSMFKDGIPVLDDKWKSGNNLDDPDEMVENSPS